MPITSAGATIPQLLFLCTAIRRYEKNCLSLLIVLPYSKRRIRRANMRRALETSVGLLLARAISICVVLAATTAVANGNPMAVTPPETPLPAVPDVSAPDTREVVDGNTAFAMNLYARLRMANGNLFFSPDCDGFLI